MYNLPEINHLETSRSQEEIFKLLQGKSFEAEFVERGDFDWQSAVKVAKHDIFISGTTLTHYVGAKDLFMGVDSSISVKFLVLNLNNSEDLNAFRRMRYQDNEKHTNERYFNQGKVFKDLYNTLRGCENIFFAVADRVIPITFFAVDVEKLTENTMIRVQHYLYEKEADQATVSYIVRPGDTLFERIREQVAIIWRYAIKDKEKLYFHD